MVNKVVSTSVNDGLIATDGNCKLKLISKKLKSGRCQVKFFAELPGKKEYYGYALAEANDTLKGVVESITTAVRNAGSHVDFRHRHLYSLQKSHIEAKDIIIFES